jgi:protein Mpv17
MPRSLRSATARPPPSPIPRQFVEKKEVYDVNRTLRLASFGLLLHGTTGHYFYGFLDSKLPGTAPMTVVTKVGAAQEQGRASPPTHVSLSPGCD